MTTTDDPTVLVPGTGPWSRAARAVHLSSLRPRAGLPGPDVVSLSIGEPDFPTPPMIIEEMTAALHAGYTHYADSSGDPELRTLLATETQGSGDYTPDDVTITHGGNGGLAAALTAVVDPGDRVIIPEPTYSLYNDIVRMIGATPVYVPLAPDMTLDLDKIATHLPGARMIILCNPGNPTGAVIPRHQLEALAALTADAGALVLSDEAYADIVYDDDFTPARTIDTWRDRLIVCNTFSKSFAMTGWRLGSMLAPTDITKAIRTAHRTTNGGLNSAVQRAALVAVRHRAELVAPQVAEYRKRRDLMVELLGATETLRFTKPAGAFYLFARYDGPERSVDVTRRLAENGVLVRAGREYGPSGEHHIRLSFAAGTSAIEEGVARLLQTLG